ncbi:MAG: diguanylate cyclase [Candidatus Muiribacteriaceae bacterium]
MKKVIYNILNIMIIILAGLFLYYSDTIYTEFYAGRFSGLKTMIEYIPVFLMLAGIFMAAHFNRTRVVFLNLILIPAYLIYLRAGLTQQDMFLLLIFIILNYIFMRIFSEKGIFTIHGSIRILFIIFEIAVFIFIRSEYGNYLKKNIEMLPALTPEQIYVIISVVMTALLASVILFGRKSYQPFFSKATSISLIIITGSISYIMLNRISWGLRQFIYTSIFSFQALIMMSAIYLSTWNRVFTDELTGLLNRRALDESLPKLGKIYSVTMMDIDHFKDFNDTYGHQAGDDVLVHVAGILQSTTFGKKYRYGGEEFSVISPGKISDQVFEHVDEFRAKLAKSPLRLRRAKKKSQIGKKVTVTASLGIASATEFMTDPVDVIKAADGALYRAKKNGRNRVEVERRKKRRKKKK